MNTPHGSRRELITSYRHLTALIHLHPRGGWQPTIGFMRALTVEGVRVEGSSLIVAVRNAEGVDLVVDEVFIKRAVARLHALSMKEAMLK